MKEIGQQLSEFSGAQIAELETSGSITLTLGNQQVTLIPEDVEIATEDIPGWLVATEGNMTIALDIHISPELRQEGIAREFINKIQNIRKESGFEVTDRISLKIKNHDLLDEAIALHREYISTQTLATSLELVPSLDPGNARLVEIENGVETWISVEKNK